MRSWPSASIRTYTQEDPIGLAGGLNLYGFANGDPINFSDPFGLCPPGDIACSWLEAGFTALGSVAGFVIGGGGGSLVAALTGGLGTVPIPAGAWQGVAIGAAAGLALAKFFSSSEGEESVGGGKSPQEYDRHVQNKTAAGRRLADLERKLEGTKGPNAQRPIREEIDRLRQDFKGHEKEIRQKWPQGRP